jgi:hypothetical protein
LGFALALVTVTIIGTLFLIAFVFLIFSFSSTLKSLYEDRIFVSCQAFFVQLLLL